MSQGDIYEGKVKLVETLDEDRVKITYLDKITAGNGTKKDTKDGKGKLNLKLTNMLFDIAKTAGVPNHTLEILSDHEIVAKKLDIFKIEVVVRNIAAGSYARRYGITDGTKLDDPIVEYFIKSDELNDPVIGSEIVLKQGLANPEELSLLKTRALQVNSAIKPYFEKAGMLLVDFKLEFGKDDKGDIYLADELSGDSMRVWDKETKEKLDKDRFRKDLGDVLAGYQEIISRLENTDYNASYVSLKAIVSIGPKSGVTNPAGEVTKRALTNSGMSGIGGVSIGKTITIGIREPKGNEWIHQLHQVTSELLSNPLIEEYTIQYEITKL